MAAARKRLTLARVETNACACPGCQAMCTLPCWLTVAEATALIDAGFSERLALDEWVPAPKVLSCAERGREGGEMSWGRSGGCTFQRPDGLCELHDLALKPIEGRAVTHEKRAADNGYGLHETVAATWNTKAGKALLARWLARKQPAAQRPPDSPLEVTTLGAERE